MNQHYLFWIDGERMEIEFDDRRSVIELIEHLFDIIDCYEPLGMDIVKLFECHSPKDNCGWMIIDTQKSCAEAIKNRNELCIAYSMPGKFYFAEGGWGHHMIELGNHPHLDNPVMLHLRFENFDNTVVIAGDYSLLDIIKFLESTNYIEEKIKEVEIFPIGDFANKYKVSYISVNDERLKMKLSEFDKTILADFSSLITLR